MLGIFSSKVSRRCTQSLHGWIFIAWLGVWTQRTAGQGPGAEVVTAAEGETATLTAPVTARVLSFAWYRGTATVDPAQVIINYVVPTSEQITGPLSTGRESMSPNGTLHIRDLRTSDTGNYTVLVTLSTGVGGPTASRQLAVYGTDLPPMGSLCPTPCSCWQTTLGVACGVLLGAAIIVAVMAVHYERRLKQKDTIKDKNIYQNPSVIKNADTQYENVRKGREEQSANQGSAADPAYMELKHGDRATYEQIKRP